MPDAPVTNVRVSRNDWPQNEPSVAVSLSDPRMIIATANDFRDEVTRSGLYRSTDGGRSFSGGLLPLPDGFDATADATADFGFRTQFLVAAIALNRGDTDNPMRTLDGTVVVYRSGDHGRTFAEPVIVNRGRGTAVFLDKPSLAIDRSEQSPYDGAAYVSYTMFLRDFTGSVLAIQRSEDGGRSWSDPVGLTGSGGGVQGSSIAVGRRGQVYVAWVQVASRARARVRVRRSDDGGRSYGPAVTVAGLRLVPPCRSGLGGCLPVRGWRFRTPTFVSIVADTSDGPEADTLYAVWQEFRNGEAEVLLARSRDEGDTWSEPSRVSGGGQAFFPAIAVCPEVGDVWVAYYSNQISPSPGTLLDLFVAEAAPGARGFSRRPVSSRSFSPNADPFFGEPSHFIGDYIGIAALPGGGFAAVWTDTRTGNQDIFAGVSQGTWV